MTSELLRTSAEVLIRFATGTRSVQNISQCITGPSAHDVTLFLHARLSFHGSACEPCSSWSASSSNHVLIFTTLISPGDTAHHVHEVRSCCWWRFSPQDLWLLSTNNKSQRRRAAEISQYLCSDCVLWLRNVSHFVALPINLTHSDMLAQVKEGSGENPLQKTPSHNQCQSQAGPVLTQSCPTAYSISPSTSLIFPPASQSNLLCGCCTQCVNLRWER